MEVSTVIKDGDRDVIRTVPLVQVKMALAAGYKTTRSYPPFDPLAVFAEDGAAQPPAAPTGLIYGAKVESEMSLKTVEFPIDAAFDEASALSADEVEQTVRNTGSVLTADGDVQVAALHYVDPQRFGDTLAAQAITASYGVKIVSENVSVTPQRRRSTTRPTPMPRTSSRSPKAATSSRPSPMPATPVPMPKAWRRPLRECSMRRR